MKNLMKRMTALVLFLALLIAAFPPVTVNAVTVNQVGALWDGFRAGSGTFTVTGDSRLFVVSASEPTGDLLQTAQLLQRQMKDQFEGCFEDLVWGDIALALEGDVVLVLDPASGIGADGYELDVTATTATVTAADTDGLIYGTNNLMKCFHAVDGNSISCFTGADTPDTRQRVVMLDTGRKYYTAEWICNFIRQMSWMGYNAIELHFSEDGGFRADLWDPAYYTDGFQPENDFSWLCGSHVQSWVKNPYRNDPDEDKYLTTAELVQICEVAREYHIELIPSFDSPAHMDYITWKFEQNYKANNNFSFTYNGTTYKASDTNGCINYTGRTGVASPIWPYYTTVDITSGTMARAFVFALYEDMADFFKVYAGSTDFSIGADEVNLDAENLVNGYSFTWDYSQFPGYINGLNRMLNDKGYTVRMFNDFIGSAKYNFDLESWKTIYEFDRNIEIMYWNSNFDPNNNEHSEWIWPAEFFWKTGEGQTNETGDGGRTMYNCIQTNCYYVLRVAAEDTVYPGMDARNPLNYNWNFYHSTEEKIYDEWYPADISEKGLYSENADDVPDEQLGGAYFLIWNDYAALNTEAEVWNGVKDNTGTSSNFYSLFDRMASNIIKMWNSDINSTVSYSEFAAVRDTFGYFPGFTSCSEKPELPAADTIVQAADFSELAEGLANVIETQGNYTDESWNAYRAAVEAAKTVNANRGATQEEVNNALAALDAAKAGLVEKTNEPETDNPPVTTPEEGVDGSILNVEKLTRTARLGKQVGLRITTKANVESITVVGEELTVCSSKVQTLTNYDEDVKIWLIGFPADEEGEFTYTIQAGSTGTGVVHIVVK